MLSVWASGLIKTIVSLVSSILVEEIAAEYVIARFRSDSLQRKINEVVARVISDALTVFPGFQGEIEGNVLLDYLSQPIVIRELVKTTHPTESPDINVLTEEWKKLAGRPLQGNNRLFIETFISRLKKQLWEINELWEILHIKESHEANIITINTLPNIATDVQKLVSSVEREETKKDLPEQDRIFDVKLDACWDLLRKNKPKAALVLLAEIERDFSKEKVSNYLRFRLNTLIGGCNLELGLEQVAIARFNRALALMPDNPKATANAALAALLENQVEQAIQLAQQALLLGGKDTAAPAVLVNAYAIQRGFKDLNDL